MRARFLERCKHGLRKECDDDDDDDEDAYRRVEHNKFTTHGHWIIGQDFPNHAASLTFGGMLQACDTST